MSRMFSFDATMEILGRPVGVTSSGHMGTKWNYGKPLRFRFTYSAGFVTIAKTEGNQVGYIKCDEKGFLRLQASADIFYLENTATGSNFWESPPLENDRVTLRSLDGPVLQFEGPDGFKDVEVLYNFLIAAKKLKNSSIKRTENYMVPNGNGGWIDHPEGQPYSPKPVSIKLNIKSVGIPAS
jgi:hypothetical protein